MFVESTELRKHEYAALPARIRGRVQSWASKAIAGSARARHAYLKKSYSSLDDFMLHDCDVIT